MVYIADTATVANGVITGSDARVEDYAVVRGYTSLNNEVVVKGYAVVYDVTLSGTVSVSGNAVVKSGFLKGTSSVSDEAVVRDCTLSGNVHIYGNAKVLYVVLKGNVHVFGNAVLNCNHLDFRVTLAGSCKFGGNATFKGLKTPEDFIEKYGEAKVRVVGREVILTDVWDMG